MGPFSNLFANILKKDKKPLKPLPIESVFKLPSSIPNFPPGNVQFIIYNVNIYDDILLDIQTIKSICT